MGAGKRAGEKLRIKKLHQANAAARRAFTRAKAERLVARTDDLEVLQSERIIKHKNKHVVAKAKRKIAQLQAT